MMMLAEEHCSGSEMTEVSVEEESSGMMERCVRDRGLDDEVVVEDEIAGMM